MSSGEDKRIPVIDLFAGPGGLGEGFSRYPFRCDPRFKVVLSVEKEENAHKTLLTRAFYREFSPGQVPEAYYEHLRGEISQEKMFQADERCELAASEAKKEALCMELGEPADKDMSPQEKIDQLRKTQRELRKLIRERVDEHEYWVLIGGPPCQAYSLAGRSRMQGVVRRTDETPAEYAERKRVTMAAFEGDHRHLLYREYLSIIADHWPPVFVMENVKGLLSAKLNGEPVFPMIRKDLADPKKALGLKRSGYTYRICSLTVPSLVPGEGLEGKDFLIRAEKHGVPQKRHRVILLGIRDDLAVSNVPTLQETSGIDLKALFQGLPGLVPGVTKPRGVDLKQVASEISKSSWLKKFPANAAKGTRGKMKDVQRLIRSALREIRSSSLESGEEFAKKPRMKSVPGELGEWLEDPLLGGVCNHTARSHMASDLHRYLYASCFAEVFGRSARLDDFPDELLPDHANVRGEEADLKKFADRFRVQAKGEAATTITCHISKDGHYFIHFEPNQMRSLTVREAARIQTFPDNYFFEGGRTAQYTQVGNAVPPFLAHQIAEIVAEVFDQVEAG